MDVMELSAPAAVLDIARRLEDAGFEAWAVGGAIRDVLMGRAAGDWDLATRATPKEVRRIFRRTVPIGVEHGTVGVLGDDDVLYEVTTFRRDVETFGRHAVVEFADAIQDDLARRDFTINAVAWRPTTRELIDPHEGLRDMERGVLRTVGDAADRFAEDYLRVLRALRFAGHFELEIDPDTWTALRAATAELGRLSAERVREELWKVLGGTRLAARSLELYATSGALDVVVPELAAVTAVQDEVDGARPWDRALGAVEALAPSRVLLRTAALLHAVGMPGARTKDLRGGWRYTGHEVTGAGRAEEVMRRLKASNAQTERVRRLVLHQSDLFPPDADTPLIIRWLRRVGTELVNDLWRLRIALWRGGHPGETPPVDLPERWRMARAVLATSPALVVKDLAIGGHDLQALGIEPGPAYGEILEALLERVTDAPELNEPEALRELVRRQMAT